MPKLYLYVTSVPPGEAPLWVREQWVGLTLPIAQAESASRAFLTKGVLSGPRAFLAELVALLRGQFERQSGFLVEASAAVAVLQSSNPQAAAWWQENTPHLLKHRRNFVFHESVGYVISRETEA